jgi:hypothetical protein
MRILIFSSSASLPWVDGSEIGIRSGEFLLVEVQMMVFLFLCLNKCVAREVLGWFGFAFLWFWI